MWSKCGQFWRPYPIISIISGTFEGFKRQWSTRLRRWSKKFRRRLFSSINAPYAWLIKVFKMMDADWPTNQNLKTCLISIHAWAIWGKLKTFLDIKKWFQSCITNFSSLLTSYLLSKSSCGKYRGSKIRVNRYILTILKVACKFIYLIKHIVSNPTKFLLTEIITSLSRNYIT